MLIFKYDYGIRICMLSIIEPEWWTQFSIWAIIVMVIGMALAILVIIIWPLVRSK